MVRSGIHTFDYQVPFAVWTQQRPVHSFLVLVDKAVLTPVSLDTRGSRSLVPPEIQIQIPSSEWAKLCRYGTY
jgi:hypothetical protein